MKALLLMIVLSCCAACKKAEKISPYSFVQVKYAEDGDYIKIETTTASWNSSTRLARLDAVGYAHQRFSLKLSNIKDTGYYPSPSAANISYADGADFISDTLNSGFIYISYMDSVSLMGNFTVSLGGAFNGAKNRVVTGVFGIGFP